MYGELDYDKVEESPFFSDDAELIHNMLFNEWGLGPEDMPDMAHEPESLMMSGVPGAIYVYQLTRNSTVSSVDYNTLTRTSTIGIKLTTRFRDILYRWGNELYRILLANRRTGTIGNYTYLEIMNDRVSNDESGWYSVTIDVRLTRYNMPIRSAGFGDLINKQIDDSYKR